MSNTLTAIRPAARAILLTTGLGLAAAGALLPGQPAAAPERYEIDPEHFSILFAGGHIAFQQQLGMFLEGHGSFVYDEETQALSDLVVEIDTTSVFTNHAERDRHLRSADFLDAARHPVARFVMTEATPATDTTGTVTGDLTFRGVTRPVTLDVTLNRIAAYPWGDNYVIGISAETVIRRSDFGSTYGIEGDLVSDEIAVRFELEAIRQD